MGLGEVPGVDAYEEDDLTLRVALRSYRSPSVAEWVVAVIEGRSHDACDLMRGIGDYPIVLTRDLQLARD